MKRTKLVLLPNVLKNLEIMGSNIKMARLRRNLSMSLVCQRARISRPTLMKVEAGSPDVSMGIYASVLNALGGSDDELRKVLKEDELGRTIMELGIQTPKRGGR